MSMPSVQEDSWFETAPAEPVLYVLMLTTAIGSSRVYQSWASAGEWAPDHGTDDGDSAGPTVRLSGPGHQLRRR